MTPEEVVPHAARLVCGVTERNPAETHDVLLSLDVHGLRALAVVLAASVDPDKPLGGTGAAPNDGQVVGRVALAVTIRTGVSVTSIYGRSRQTDQFEARALVCWIASALGVTSAGIGRALQRDHSTVLNATAKVTATPRLLALAQQILDDVSTEGVAA
jgi:hypothetical protein